MKRLTIIGGGLSGLYAAAMLQKRYDITLFEARDRLGGRVLSPEGFDMGPSWVWSHQERILSLIRSLGLKLFAQYASGQALYETPSGVQRFDPPPSPPAGRMIGGIQSLTDALAESLQATAIRQNQAVTALRAHSDCIEIDTVRGSYTTDLVLSTLPPRVALHTLRYDPPLETPIAETLASVPTWMGHSAKCVVEFASPFWRELGLSGFAFSHAGPLGEIHDACTYDRYALFGFVASHAPMATLERDVRDQMRRLFGPMGETILSIRVVDWRDEPCTAVAEDRRAPTVHPPYGFTASAYDGRLRFIGTESAYREGGYLEGAIRSVDQILPLY